ncbi:MAG: 3-dehydroquinate synthase [Candidatus Dormiibacterota bacterium]
MTVVTRIALVGLPGSGKSTIAPLLAERLGWSFVDLDEEITAAESRTPAAIIEAEGEEAFRELEVEALRQAIGRPGPVVIACGGGLINWRLAGRLLTDMCCVVWLDAPDDVLVGRLGDVSNRPLLAGSAVTGIPRLRALRAGAHQSAHARVRSDVSPGIVADRIAGALGEAIPVDAAGRRYFVEVRPGAIDDLIMYVPGGATSVAVIADRSVAAQTDRVVASLRSAGISTTLIEVSGGESLKTWESAGSLLDRLGSAGLQRNDCVVAIGGGTVGDVAGFAAATYLRGIAWVNVPTTLLAMVDSAIGGKTGVNLVRGKNLAGAFWQPQAVVCDPDLLATQDDRSYRSALAEIIKYAMIADPRWFGDLDARLDGVLRREPEVLTQSIRESCAVKARFVSFDERETGMRAILNYGHTVGHALEAATGLGDGLLHGEAVALGMRAAGLLSVRELGCPAEDIAWQDEMIARCGLGTSPVVDAARVLEHMGADKKHVGGKLGWVLLESRGHARSGQHVPEPDVRAALETVLAR